MYGTPLFHTWARYRSYASTSTSMSNPAGRAISLRMTAIFSRIGGELAANSLNESPLPWPASRSRLLALPRSGVRMGSLAWKA